MIKNFEQFLNESVKRYQNADNDYFEEYIDLSERCMLANIEFIKYRYDGHADFKEPLKLKFYDGGNYNDKYIKIRQENVVSIYVDNDIKKAEEMLGGELTDKNKKGEFLIAVTEDDEHIVLDRAITIQWDCVFNINSNLEYIEYKHSKETDSKEIDWDKKFNE